MRKKIVLILLTMGLLLSSCTKSIPNNQNNATQNQVKQATAIPLPTPTPTPLPATDLSIGEMDFYAGDFDSALQEFAAAQNTTDSAILAEAILFTGRIALQRQDYTTAVAKLGNLVNSQPTGDARNTAFFFLAQSYEGLQEYQLAADAYQNYLNSVPDSPLKSDILVMQGDDLTAAGNNAAALAAYQTALPLAQPEYQDQDALKVAKATAATGDSKTAIAEYLDLYNTTSNNYTKSSANFLLGQLYLQQGDTANAYARFQDSVAQFPAAYDTYSGLVALVNANQPVDDLLRGIVDYYASQYGMAISAFDRYMTANPKHDATVNYYKALSYYNMGDYQNEVAEWDKLIQNYPTDAYYAEAFIEKATTQWDKLLEFGTAAQTLLAYVAQAPTSDKAASYLYSAGRIYEQGNQLEQAGLTWERVASEYPAYEKATLAQFNAGICYYRLGEFTKALVTFQRNALLNSNAADKARAEMWIGKTQQKLNQKDAAKKSFQQAASDDPTGYYSIRANELLNGQTPFNPSASIDLGVNLAKEKSDAVDWMHTKFSIPTDVDLLSTGDLANNILYQRGDAFWKLGMTIQAQSEFESLRQQLATDAVNSFRLMNHLLDLNINQTAILCARQILDIIGLGDTTMMDQTPAYFNHVRFGVYFRNIIVSSAAENNLDSLAVFSIIRQESLFEPEVSSSQGATGLMQIMPSVGKEIVADYNWPANYIDSDLIRPYINVKLGTHYLTKWYSYFDNDMIAALAAYNGGIGYTLNWVSLANSDPDLLLEVIPDNFETQDYIRQIREDFEIYKTIYTRQ